MGDLTKNISRFELKCKCNKCDCDTVDSKTAELVQECVDHFAILHSTPIFLYISSGHRCGSYNVKIGGASKSQHLSGRAMDFYLYYLDSDGRNTISPSVVYDYLDKKHEGKYGVGKYRTFTHFDTKSGGARRW